jgi:hypothetical protein
MLFVGDGVQCGASAYYSISIQGVQYNIQRRHFTTGYLRMLFVGDGVQCGASTYYSISIQGLIRGTGEGKRTLYDKCQTSSRSVPLEGESDCQKTNWRVGPPENEMDFVYTRIWIPDAASPTSGNVVRTPGAKASYSRELWADCDVTVTAPYKVLRSNLQHAPPNM